MLDQDLVRQAVFVHYLWLAVVAEISDGRDLSFLIQEQTVPLRLCIELDEIGCPVHAFCEALTNPLLE